MPNNKRHSLKDIKNKDKAHPYSRKANQIQRAIDRSIKVEKKKMRAERFLWFSHALDEELISATMEEVHDLIQTYLDRNEEELSTNSKSFQADMIKLQHAKELKEYEVEGFEVPDLTNMKNVKLLREWDGDVNSIQSIKSVIITKPKEVKEDNTDEMKE
ncbi:hypothetical protein CONCODRAFT_80802 [Conidiobolus coronatus NRRL 28638]|uniref:Translation machinery-associated protein 16 n=1 Tax=Conidiobolus coronatus (strain ATCC 28846 / CBS 209.66 / NRRL 28638) TaxID=796925 RepID=A0A137NRI9_CONC2|nr:hypothetical protein CONCODRAFT_80802 [Conidiobolus coronatus NRRL 28638]|eukprot:KXN65300.1 hypothetical protein CONCODRAFT_80802 [Conidiobolus coronatus NRRL 28638]